MVELTQVELKEILHYDPDTGKFTWNDCRNSCVHKGDSAGTYCDRYIRISIDGKSYRAHRLAFLYMEGELPSDCVDHINRVRDDNRWCNLRHATRRQNNHNASTNNKDIGVCKHKASGKWAAYGDRINGKLPYLGLHEEYEDALAARKEWEAFL